MNVNTVKTIEKILGVEFEKDELLKTAFTHRSYLNENRDVKEHNERLEYLGDAVLEFLVSKFLYTNFPGRPEGDLTSFRSAIVKTETLAKTARELKFGKFLRMSQGEERTGGRDKDYLMANTFESVLGAMFLDGGIDQCDEFVNRVLFTKVENIVENRLDIDPKTKFQEIAQDRFKVTPTYELLSETGPDHEKSFEMGVFIGDKQYGKGKGPSKQKAEEEAAKGALSRISAEKKQNFTPKP